MDKQELINRLKEILATPSEISGYDFDFNDGYDFGIERAISLAEDLDEPVIPPELEKPLVPQFLADWYEESKGCFEYNLCNLCVDFHERKLQEDLHEWFNILSNKPIETLIMMHKIGYEVEKEKLYTVELPNPNAEERPILYKKDGEVCIIFPSVPCWREVKNAQLTESEIKQDFDWAWKFRKEVEMNND